LLTNEESGTTSNPSCSARRVSTISVTRVLIQATVPGRAIHMLLSWAPILEA
jgi:hypothetical protein